MWRLARPDDDAAIVAMCLELYREDPGPRPVGEDFPRRTLDSLRREPSRGRAVVLEIDGRPAGYAFLISFWSNELGGEICDVDELFVVREHRNQGLGTKLFDSIGSGELWPSRPVGMALIVTPGNARARHLYERLGFDAVGTTMIRRASL